MTVAPVSEDDSLAKVPLFTKYVETLPRALDGWKETGLDMILHLLGGIQKVLRHNTDLHQKLFRSAHTPSHSSAYCLAFVVFAYQMQ